MNKQAFIDELRKKLSGLPRQDIDERLTFYSEMIDDRVEEGCTEEEAVLNIGSVDDIAAQIIKDMPFPKIAKERMKQKRQFKTWEIVLLALGAPIWFSLAIVVFAVILSLYVVLWAVIVSIWAIFVSFVVCALGGVLAAIIFAFSGKSVVCIAMFGVGSLCAGLAIFLFFGSKAVAQGMLRLTGKIAFAIKNSVIKKRCYDAKNG